MFITQIADVKEKNIFLNRLLEKHATCDADTASLRALIAERDTSLAHQEAELVALRAEHAPCTDMIAGLRGEVADVVGRHAACDALIASLRMHIAEVEADLAANPRARPRAHSSLSQWPYVPQRLFSAARSDGVRGAARYK